MSRMPASERTDSSSSGRSDGWRRTRRYAAFAAIIYAVWCIAVFSIQEKFIFPIGLIAPASKQAPRGVESIWVESEPGVKVEAWLLPPTTGTRAEKAPAVIYCHGNAELIDHCVERVQGWRERGFAVMLIEYRGYGRSGGRPGQAGIAADAIRFYDALANRPEIDSGKILIHGRSLGGGVACQLAAARPCAGLVLESTFTSVASFAWSMGVPPFLVKHPFRNDAVVSQFKRPLLILHGDRDEIISVKHGRKLKDLAGASMYAEMGGDHNNFPDSWEDYWGAVDVFLRVNGL